MTDLAAKALLPVGLLDLLPPHAAFEAAAAHRLMAVLASHGYERVDPPLVEFEEGLLSGSGSATAGQTFRLMDPVSQRMLGIRPDMTTQVARIAATRLAGRARPLRLGYAGPVLRVRGTEPRTRRQFAEVGAELIGSASPRADVEVILLAVESLQGLGIGRLSVDLGLPTLVPAVCRDLGLGVEAGARLRAALDRKDAAEVASLEASLVDGGTRLFSVLLGAAGPAGPALGILAGLPLGEAAGPERDRLILVAEGVRAAAPGLGLTIDPVENRGFEYHTGVTFLFFAAGTQGELGSGGRYRAGLDPSTGEPATGFTLFMDTLMEILPLPPVVPRVLLAFDSAGNEGRRLRDEGWITVNGLEDGINPEAEAIRLGCTHVLADGAIREVTGDGRKPHHR